MSASSADKPAESILKWLHSLTEVWTIIRQQFNIFPLLVEVNPPADAPVVGYREIKLPVGVERTFWKKLYVSLDYTFQVENPFAYVQALDPALETVFLSFDTGDRLAGVPLLTHDRSRRVRHLVRWIGEEEQARRSPELRSILLEALVVELRRLGDARPDPWLEDMLTFMRRNLARQCAHRLIVFQ